MKRILLTLIVLLGMSSLCNAQTSSTPTLWNKKEPLVFLDGTKMSMEQMNTINPNDIESITVIKDSSALKAYGEEGRNGVILITSKNRAVPAYVGQLRSLSSEYAKIVEKASDEDQVAYILNGKLLDKKDYSDLEFVDSKNFVQLTVLDSQELAAKYSVHNKKYGVVITYKQKCEM